MLVLHRKSHKTKDKFVCDMCEYKGNTQYNLEQHQRGAHGPRWVALCGVKFSWKTQISSHVKSCKPCQAANASQQQRMDKIRKLCK